MRQLAKQGEQYPVSLDEVWPLVYNDKGRAVRALKRSAIENTDYQIFNTNVKNSSAGRPELIYKLSVPCLEFFIACKVRAIFEVYRQVFHQAVDSLEKANPIQKRVGRYAKQQKETRWIEARINGVESRVQFTGSGRFLKCRFWRYFRNQAW